MEVDVLDNRQIYLFEAKHYTSVYAVYSNWTLTNVYQQFNQGAFFSRSLCISYGNYMSLGLNEVIPVTL